MLGGIKHSNMMLKSIVIFSDFPEQKTPVFLKFGLMSAAYLVRSSLFLIKQSRSSIGNWTPKSWENVGKGGRPGDAPPTRSWIFSPFSWIFSWINRGETHSIR